jgi:hypothetical protein
MCSDGGVPTDPQTILGRVREGDYAARRSYRWCRPPTCGIATTGPSVGGAIGRGCGESLASERCVRDWW